ncbi:uncharacterized protein LOC126560480 [Anopheles maculipalpis]|uniref:uncharacterized protein LOC126560480 n=1 Tax=Anopheles maculipalpis TaxID=1496333 RepID=UPI0021595A33|nr:uncharacterized protein LOC126560480 [Anopheles maculipalpis]
MNGFIVLLFALGAIYPSATVLAQPALVRVVRQENQLPEDVGSPEQQDQSVQSVQSIQSIREIKQQETTAEGSPDTATPEAQTPIEQDTSTAPAQFGQLQDATTAPSNPTDAPEGPNSENPNPNNPSPTSAPSPPVPVVLNMNVIVLGEGSDALGTNCQTEISQQKSPIFQMQSALRSKKRKSKKKNRRIDPIQIRLPLLVTEPVTQPTLWDDEDYVGFGRSRQSFGKGDCLFC